MKPFAKYLAESERTYDYRIKILGRVSDDLVRQLKQKLDQFDPVSLGDVRATPIQKVPTDFPNDKNQAVSMFDVKFKYPAIDAQVKQLWQLLGQNPNHIIMGTSKHAEGLAQEYQRIEDENRDLLKDTDFPEPDAEQRALKKDYAADPQDHVVLKNAYRSDFTVAGGRTPPAKTTNDIATGNKSPMTNVKRPAKPATGRNPKG